MEAVRDALIVASDEYQDPGLRRLRAPAQDADALYRVLKDREIGDFRVRKVLNEPAHVIREAVEEFFADRRRDDLLLLHFSCHGVKDKGGELYFAATNTKLRLLGATAIAAEFVNRCMHRSMCRRILLLLDCCYAGAFERGMVARADRDVGIEERLGGRGRAVITASSAMEYAFEGAELTEIDELKPSVFTSALVEGLKTGDADRDEDGYVGLDELYEYVYDKVRESTSSQTPGMWTFGVQGALYIARSRRVSRLGLLPTPPQQAIDYSLSSGSTALPSSDPGPSITSESALLAAATSSTRLVRKVARQAVALIRHKRLLFMAGISAIVAAVLLIVAAALPWYGPPQPRGFGGFGRNPTGPNDLYAVIVAALAATGGFRLLISRAKPVAGPSVLLGITAASPSGLVDAFSALSHNSGAGPFLWVAAHLVLVITFCLVGVWLKLVTDVNITVRRPHGSMAWFVLLLGLASAIQLLRSTAVHPAVDLDWLRLIVYFLAMTAAFLMPVCATMVTPRRFGVGVLRGWIAGIVALYLLLSVDWIGLYGVDLLRYFGNPVSPVAFGLSLLVLLIAAVPFGRAAPYPPDIAARVG